jgi:hypothetical protein
MEFVPRYSPSFFFPFLFLPPCSATVGLIFYHRYGSDDVSKVTLPAWPGQGLDAIVIFRPIRPICILIRTRMLFCFMYYLDRCMYICILDSWSLRGYYILLWVLLWTCVTVATRFHPHHVHAKRAWGAWWCVSKVASCRLWHDCYNLQGADFGASQVVSKPGFVDTHSSSLPVG